MCLSDYLHRRYLHRINHLFRLCESVSIHRSRFLAQTRCELFHLLRVCLVYKNTYQPEVQEGHNIFPNGSSWFCNPGELLFLQQNQKKFEINQPLPAHESEALPLEIVTGWIRRVHPSAHFPAMTFSGTVHRTHINMAAICTTICTTGAFWKAYVSVGFDYFFNVVFHKKPSFQINTIASIQSGKELHILLYSIIQFLRFAKISS